MRPLLHGERVRNMLLLQRKTHPNDPEALVANQKTSIGKQKNKVV
jgi:hypothetical protein